MCVGFSPSQGKPQVCWTGDSSKHAKVTHVMTLGRQGQQILVALGKGATLINIGRGNIISDTELLRALENGWLKEAVLDVFNIEPLPKDHPFWTHPKVIVTPHVAGNSPARMVAQCVAKNIGNIDSGRLLDHLVSWDQGY